MKLVNPKRFSALSVEFLIYYSSAMLINHSGLVKCEMWFERMCIYIHVVE